MARKAGSESVGREEVRMVPFVIKGVDAKRVSVTGDFSGWSEDGIRLVRGREGEWQTTLELEPGEYQYRLRVDGEWRDDESAERRVANPFGSENDVLEVKKRL
jgi:1,4-alpha-glucan branching enzyme